MLISRRSAVVLALLLCVSGCAGNTEPAASAPSATSPASSAPASLPSSSPPQGAQTVTGTVVAGVEPNCLLIQDSAGSHLLFFDDPALRAEAPVGKKVTVTGRSEPTMMSTCQQGVPFVVSSVSPA